MAQLTIHVLGAPKVLVDGALVAFPTRKTLALLLYLAIERGTHSRDRVVDLLWPDSASSAGRATLRGTLSLLKRSLGPAAGAIASDGYGIKIDRTAFDIITDLDVVMGVADPDSAGPASTDDQAALDGALALERGDFLDGFDLEDAPQFEEWSALRREAARRAVSQIYGRSWKHLFDTARFDEAVYVATRWTTRFPDHERAYRCLMRSQFASGKRSAALSTYERARMTFERTLDARLSASTTALYRRFMDSGAPATPIGDRRPALFEPPFTGRATEFRLLTSKWHEVARGGASAILVCGEAGIGKSRIARELSGWALTIGGDVIEARATAGSRLTYGPLTAALRDRIARENAPDDLLNDVWLSELSRLLPELRDRYPDLPTASADESTAQVRLFEAIASAIHAFAEKTPVLLIIDDVQWADSTTLDCIQYCLERWEIRGTSILTILGLRGEAAATSLVLAGWLEALARRPSVERINLEPLTYDDTRRIVAQFSHEEKVNSSAEIGSLSAWLYRETAGQPFYLIEMLRLLRSLGRRPASGHGDAGQLTIGIPPTVREVIKARLSPLTPEAFSLLVAGAVLAKPIDFSTLVAVANVDESAGLFALDIVLSAGLMRAAGPADFYQVAHDTIRDVVYTEAGEARRRSFHRRAAAIFVRVGPPSEVLYHALAAGQPDLALPAAIRAGDEAFAVFAIRAAIDHYRQALRLANGLKTASAVVEAQKDLGHVMLQLGRAYELAGNFADARMIYEDGEKRFRAKGATGLAVAFLIRQAALATQTGNPHDAIPMLLSARPLAEAANDEPTIAEVDCSLAQAALYSGRVDDAWSWGRSALDRARKLANQPLSARCLSGLAIAAVQLCRYVEAQAYAAEGAAMFSSLGDQAMSADCLTHLATALIALGQPAEAVDAGQTAISLSVVAGNPWGKVTSGFSLARALIDTGHLERALQAAEASVVTARSMGVDWLLTLSLVSLGAVQRTLGLLDLAWQTHSDAFALHERLAVSTLGETVLAELVADAVAARDWDNASRYARQSLAARRRLFSTSVGMARWQETVALLRLGAVQAALDDLQSFEERLGESPRFQISCARARAAISAHLGKQGSALTHLRRALASAEHLGLPLEEAAILADIGAIQQETGNKRSSELAYSQAGQIYQSIANSIANEPLRISFLGSVSFVLGAKHAYE